jgi:hypothetical protein
MGFRRAHEANAKPVAGDDRRRPSGRIVFDLAIALATREIELGVEDLT